MTFRSIGGFNKTLKLIDGAAALPQPESTNCHQGQICKKVFKVLGLPAAALECRRVSEVNDNVQLQLTGHLIPGGY